MNLRLFSRSFALRRRPGELSCSSMSPDLSDSYSKLWSKPSLPKILVRIRLYSLLTSHPLPLNIFGWKSVFCRCSKSKSAFCIACLLRDPPRSKLPVYHLFQTSLIPAELQMEKRLQSTLPHNGSLHSAVFYPIRDLVSIAVRILTSKTPMILVLSFMHVPKTWVNFGTILRLRHFCQHENSGWKIWPVCE